MSATHGVGSPTHPNASSSKASGTRHKRRGVLATACLLVLLLISQHAAAKPYPTPDDEAVQLARQSIRDMLDTDQWIRLASSGGEIPPGIVVSTTKAVSKRATAARLLADEIGRSHRGYTRASNAAQWAELARWVTAGLLCSGWLVSLVSKLPWHSEEQSVTLSDSYRSFMLQGVTDPGGFSPRDVGIDFDFYDTKHVVRGCGFPSGKWNPPSLPKCSDLPWWLRLFKTCRSD